MISRRLGSTLGSIGDVATSPRIPFVSWTQRPLRLPPQSVIHCITLSSAAWGVDIAITHGHNSRTTAAKGRKVEAMANPAGFVFDSFISYFLICGSRDSSAERFRNFVMTMEAEAEPSGACAFGRARWWRLGRLECKGGQLDRPPSRRLKLATALAVLGVILGVISIWTIMSSLPSSASSGVGEGGEAPLTRRAADAQRDRATPAQTCPALATVSELDLAEYIRASWYAQQQQLVGSQSESDLNCVAATYELEDRKVPGFDGPVVTAYNHARRDSFLGPRTNVTLCARAAFDTLSKMSVAPCFMSNKASLSLPTLTNHSHSSTLAPPLSLPHSHSPVFPHVAPDMFPLCFHSPPDYSSRFDEQDAGPYWIAALGREGSRYTWAVVVGGQPSIVLSDGCTTPERAFREDSYGRASTGPSGLWLLTREPVASEATFAEMHAAMEQRGIARSKLRPVKQQGCSYDDFRIKADTKLAADAFQGADSVKDASASAGKGAHSRIGLSVAGVDGPLYPHGGAQWAAPLVAQQKSREYPVLFPSLPPPSPSPPPPPPPPVVFPPPLPSCDGFWDGLHCHDEREPPYDKLVRAAWEQLADWPPFLEAKACTPICTPISSHASDGPHANHTPPYFPAQIRQYKTRTPIFRPIFPFATPHFPPPPPPPPPIHHTRVSSSQSGTAHLL